MDISQPLNFDKHGILELGAMRVGFVKPSAVAPRRANPRAMEQAELNALRSSIDSLGFKSFVLVEELAPGKYGIVDGHHRVQVLNEKKAARIPVVLVDPDAGKDQVDLAMLSFNVTGKPNGPVYIDFIRDLVDRIGSDVVGMHVALDAKFLEDITSTMDEAMAAASESATKLFEDLEENEEKGEFWQGRPLHIELINNAETHALIADVRRITGKDTDGQAVLEALTIFVAEHG